MIEMVCWLVLSRYMICWKSYFTMCGRICKNRWKEQIQTNQINWRRYRRMVIQLFSLASLFLPLTLPAMTVSIVQNCCLPTFASSIFVPYLNFLVRFLTLLLPFLCLSLFPELWPKLFFCKNNHVQPVRTIRARTLLTWVFHTIHCSILFHT